MKEIVNQSVGIDCAKADFTVTFSVCDSDRQIEHLSSRTFVNEENGFKAFNKWAGKFQKKGIPLIIVMEATGVYHERLACFLYDLKYAIAVVVPKRAKDFSKTLKVKKVNDKIASKYLAIMGLEKKLDLWSKPNIIYTPLKRLSREKERISQHIVQLKNQLEAETSGAWPDESAIERINETISLLKKHKTQVLKKMKEVVASDETLKEKVDRITSIPGVGIMTAVAVIGETNGFNLVANKRQLVSYAGYDVMNQESGTSIYTKPRISKRGNRHIRKAMHMAALSSIRSEEHNKATFIRIVSKNGIKMKGVVAVQRKLLVLIYTLWKTHSYYDPMHYEKKEGSSRLPHELDQVRSLNR
jgi:transposase